MPFPQETSISSSRKYHGGSQKVSNNIKRHYSQKFTLWNFHHPPWHLKLFMTITTNSPPPFLLVFMKALCPSHSKNWFAIWVNKVFVCLYFLLSIIFVFRLFKYESHPCSCIWQKDKYIISAPEPKHLVLIHTNTHTHTLLTPMLFLDLSHPTKTDDAHFIILHSSIHITVNLCRPSDSFKQELNCCWPWLLQCQIYILWFHTKLREIIMDLSINDRNIPQLQWETFING